MQELHKKTFALFTNYQVTHPYLITINSRANMHTPIHKCVHKEPCFSNFVSGYLGKTALKISNCCPYPIN